MINLNAQSLRNKQEQFEHVLLSYDPHIAVISETWLHPDDPDSCLFPPSYTCYRKDRKTRGGGTAVLVKSGVPSYQLPEIDVYHESVLCKCEFLGNQIIVVGLYRPPNAEPDFLLKLYDQLNQYRNHLLLVVGDFNLPCINWETLKCGPTDIPNCEIFLDMLLAFNLTQTVLLPTRVTSSTSSILDLVLCSSTITDITTEICEGISDHKLVYFTSLLPRQSNPPQYKPITIKQYTSADDVNITNYLEEAILLFDDSDDVNTLWTKFKAHCHFCIQHFIPDKVKKVGRTNPWINREIIHVKRKLKRLRKRPNAVQADILDLQATLKSKLAASRDHYFNVTLSRFVSESPSKFWQFLSNKGGTRLDQIAKGDRVLTDPREMAEVFNE